MALEELYFISRIHLSSLLPSLFISYLFYLLSALLSSLRVPSVLCVVWLYNCACSQSLNLCSSKLGCVVVSRLEFALEGVLSHAALVVGPLGDSERVPCVLHPVVRISSHRRIAEFCSARLSRLGYQHSGARKWFYRLSVQVNLLSRTLVCLVKLSCFI